MPYNGEFHFTALRTLGTFRTMSASRRFPRSRFQPGIPAMYACTGASPSAFAMRGLPPERTTATFAPFRTLIGLAFDFALPGMRLESYMTIPHCLANEMVLEVPGCEHEKVGREPRPVG